MARHDRLRVVVADDEPNAREGLRALVAADDELSLVAVCSDGDETLVAIEHHAPDLALLDVAMPGATGIDVVRALCARASVCRPPVVVFVTAYDHFAIPAFEVNAVDYVLKPFDDDRFHEAVGRAKRRARDAAAGELNAHLLGVVSALGATRPAGDSPDLARSTATPRTRILIRQDGRSLLVRAEDIDWIEAADYCVRIHIGGRVHVHRESMTALEAQLDSRRFFRSHRSAIVNLDRVREIQPVFRGEHVMLLRDGSRLVLARSRRTALEERLGQRL